MSPRLDDIISLGKRPHDDVNIFFLVKLQCDMEKVNSPEGEDIMRRLGFKNAKARTPDDSKL